MAQLREIKAGFLDREAFPESLAVFIAKGIPNSHKALSDDSSSSFDESSDALRYLVYCIQTYIPHQLRHVVQHCNLALL
ncbi:conserved hypothetical protein [Coccidioides posadasii str. Silveira]|uniref:Uncharacterized protein n=1 Tax=Coccidioides posadasii (strain RMSCC 757 / Silveira) TaxID=443226 RepID=E9DHZ3_COCPS|nr:conserved hypothetical protein [Coccidioides posadasii str. Silveira]